MGLITMHLIVVSHACVTDINQQIYSEMESLGHKIDLIVPSNFIAPGLTKTPIKVKRWPKFKGRIIEVPTWINSSIPLHFYRKSLKKFFSENRPDAVYVAEEPYSISCFQSLLNALPHTSVIGFYSAQNINKKYPFLFHNMEKFVYAKSSLAISISKEVSDVLREKGYQKPIAEIPLGVDDTHFIISPTQKEKSRNALGIPLDAFVIGFAGRVVEEKGVDLLIKAFSYYNKQFKNSYLVIVGRGPLLKDMRNLAADLGIEDSIKFVDNAIHSEMPKWFNCMDVHVLPSKTMSNWREQFGRVLIEAAACGVPSIGSSSGEIPKVLASLGMDSIFPEGDVDGLAVKLECMGTRLIEKEKIRKVAISKYGNKEIAKQLIGSFERVVEN